MQWIIFDLLTHRGEIKEKKCHWAIVQKHESNGLRAFETNEIYLAKKRKKKQTDVNYRLKRTHKTRMRNRIGDQRNIFDCMRSSLFVQVLNNNLFLRQTQKSVLGWLLVGCWWCCFCCHFCFVFVASVAVRHNSSHPVQRIVVWDAAWAWARVPFFAYLRRHLKWWKHRWKMKNSQK